MEILFAKAGIGKKRGAGVEWRRFHSADPPFFRRGGNVCINLRPFVAAGLRNPNVAVVGADPNYARLFR